MQSLAATYMLLSLCTGTILSLLGQQMTTFGVHPSANLYVWVQYMGHFVYTEYKLRTSPRKHKYTSRQKLFMVAIGCCHVGAFLLFLPAVDKIGVALYQIIYSSGLLMTAVMARVVLKKVPSTQQLLGIAVVSAGLVHSGWGTLAKSGTEGTSSTDLAVGVALSFTATLLFCATPILVELVNSDVPAAKKLGSSDVGGAAAKLGAVVITLYVAVWTWPRRHQLVLQPLAASGTSQQQLLAWYVLNLAVYIMHNTFYLETTKYAGAVGNGLVNGVRSATVVLSSAALFCSQKPALCLDMPKCITVVLLVAGGLIYTAAPPASYLAAPTGRTSKRLAAKGIKKRA